MCWITEGGGKTSTESVQVGGGGVQSGWWEGPFSEESAQGLNRIGFRPAAL